MKCPLCNVDLVMSERQGVEIDYCPTCRGVWLDRGELDKIIEKSNASQQHIQMDRSPSNFSQGYPQGKSYDKHDYEHNHKKRRKSFLEELFD